MDEVGEILKANEQTIINTARRLIKAAPATDKEVFIKDISDFIHEKYELPKAVILDPTYLDSIYNIGLYRYKRESVGSAYRHAVRTGSDLVGTIKSLAKWYGVTEKTIKTMLTDLGLV